MLLLTFPSSPWWRGQVRAAGEGLNPRGAVSGGSAVGGGTRMSPGWATVTVQRLSCTESGVTRVCWNRLPLRGFHSVPPHRCSTRTPGPALPRFCQAVNSRRKNPDAMADASGSSQGLVASRGAPEPSDAFQSRPQSCTSRLCGQAGPAPGLARTRPCDSG